MIMMADQQKLLNRERGTTIAYCWGPLLRRMRARPASGGARPHPRTHFAVVIML